jgi:nucleoside-diphosphate kinase
MEECMNLFEEKCLILLKPDCIENLRIGEIISRIEQAGLQIYDIKMVKVTEESISKHYPDDPSWLKSVGIKKIQKFQSKGITISEDPLMIGKKVRASLIQYFKDKKVIAIIVQGPNAIACMRKMAGNTEPASSAVGTIRGDYSTDSFEIADRQQRPIKNLIHVSDSQTSSQREINIWFS